MSKVVGVVEKVKCDKPGAIWIADTRYGAFDPKVAGLSEDLEGKTVELQYTEKGEYKNVKGRVRVVDSVSTAGSSTSTKQQPYNSGYKRSSFPIDPNDGQVSIIRQNAVTNANALIANLINSKAAVFPKGEDPVGVLLEYAKIIAAYTSGELDKMEVDAIEDHFNPED